MLEGCVSSKVRLEGLLGELLDQLQELYTREPEPERLSHLCRLVRQLPLQSPHPFVSIYC